MSARFAFLSLFVSLSAVGCAAGTVPVEAPPAPAPSMPDVGIPDVAPDAGLARVLISTDVPARVVGVAELALATHRGLATGTSEHLVCEATPCAVTLPYGDHELVFKALDDPERGSTVTIHVLQSTVVVNHTLGRRHESKAPAWGSVLIGAGIIVLGVAAVLAGEQGRDGSADYQPGIAAAALGGFGGIIAGGIIIRASPTTVQDGSTTEWTPPAGAVVGASAGIAF